MSLAVEYRRFTETYVINPLNAELHPICHLLALLGAHHIFHVSGLRVKTETATLFIYLLLSDVNNSV
jgi:hypothetical protein